MAKIECNYFDKNFKPANDLGCLKVSRRDLAHALLSLHGTYNSIISRFCSYLSYWFEASARFRFPLLGNLSYEPCNHDSYDGFKRTDSEIFASAIAIVVARKKYRNKLALCLEKSQVISKNGRWPDFLTTNGVDYSLFESKGSLTPGRTISDETVDDGIDQLNAVSGVRLNDGRVVNTFKEKVVVATSLKDKTEGSRHEIKCDIYDPDNLEGEIVDFDAYRALNDYYSFVRNLIDSSGRKERVERMVAKNHLVICSVLKIADFTIEIGLLDKLYSREGLKKYQDFYEAIKDIKGNGSNSCLYPDGVYLRITEDRPFFPEN